MHKLHRQLYIFLMLLLASECTIMSHDKNQASKYSCNTVVQKLKTVWKNNWVKAGTITATCALAYAIGVKYNLFAVASAATINASQNNIITLQDSTNTNATTTEKSQENTEEAQLLQQKSYKEYGAEIAEQGKEIVGKAVSTVKAVASWFVTWPELEE
jgi:hypothetical protein